MELSEFITTTLREIVKGVGTARCGNTAYQEAICPKFYNSNNEQKYTVSDVNFDILLEVGSNDKSSTSVGADVNASADTGIKVLKVFEAGSIKARGEASGTLEKEKETSSNNASRVKFSVPICFDDITLNYFNQFHMERIEQGKERD